MFINFLLLATLNVKQSPFKSFGGHFAQKEIIYFKIYMHVPISMVAVINQIISVSQWF